MKILVTGKGGREHAILAALRQSAPEATLFAFPGSDAIAGLAKCVPARDLLDLVAFMQREKVDLCIAGEEALLVKDRGLANLCAEVGIPCWGPVKEAAQLEASKAFAKLFLQRHGIPTAAFAVAHTRLEAVRAITQYPVVLKFDGLAAGKGVAVCQDEAAAIAFLDEVFVKRAFGEGDLVIEECLTGPEISIFASICDGSYHILMPARDYKRIGDNDEGPNTGGMGAVASRHLVDEALLAEIKERIVKPTVAGLERDGLPYRGFLYFGLMLTPQGPMVLEYNCRFGDPEAEAVLPMVRGDFAYYLLSAAKGQLKRDLIHFADGWSVCMILASAGYPATSRSGDAIHGLDEVKTSSVFHCGTRLGATGFETHGGRVLAVVSQGATREEARAQAFADVERISFAGRQRRTDIAQLHFE
ncbi:MAG: phosphoribosylamine--glycine ligase [Roseimicrobium sp.]